jgi:hypothetical protein
MPLQELIKLKSYPCCHITLLVLKLKRNKCFFVVKEIKNIKTKFTELIKYPWNRLNTGHVSKRAQDVSSCLEMQMFKSNV